MDQQQAVKILQSLADGVDPRTGAVLPQDSLLQDSDVCAALRTAVARLGRACRKAAETVPANAGKPWNTTEDEKALRLAAAGKTISAIAKEHGRTTAGIEARLEFLRDRKQQRGASSFRSSGYKVGSMDERCANCGQSFGEHYNGTCPANRE
jgi:hypothetical protein